MNWKMPNLFWHDLHTSAITLGLHINLTHSFPLNQSLPQAASQNQPFDNYGIHLCYFVFYAIFTLLQANPINKQVVGSMRCNHRLNGIHGENPIWQPNLSRSQVTQDLKSHAVWGMSWQWGSPEHKKKFFNADLPWTPVTFSCHEKPPIGNFWSRNPGSRVSPRFNQIGRLLGHDLTRFACMCTNTTW